MKHKYKIGDKVKCIDDDNGSLKDIHINKIYTITFIHHWHDDKRRHIRYICITDNKEEGYLVERFEPYMIYKKLKRILKDETR